MVAKKRNTMRRRAAAAAAAAALPKGSSKEQDSSKESLGPDPRAFLHQPKETKKEKSLNKQQLFLDQVKQKSQLDPAFAGISKSSLRRRKRRLREELKPRMGDLLTSLGKEEDLKEHMRDPLAGDVTIKVLDEAHKPVSKRRNEPNIKNQRGARALSIQESARMKQVLSNASFQQNTFGALRDVIKMQNR
ncbi:SLX9 (YGR081C) [Zygosaccharomyces parabailii]|uniref:Ribosome biogenesis protein SLX9 n=1 Tax=Zygosaccharomyces bailii (strain CLIB 213 / ATCC 58445 / CBS 680 / BCRC 21525 / NBRC 1098 / NCYC 1416 / NRRL Y-2227) TaxID=1333698 RepID=A0A8J2X885_ZYGB2|nr:SLX9 (YGR081C) [Zygosaccharomyces parabailii]CDF89688.1 ZYBA0S04-10242g1_1 [Zygosaccharomyces bailii CLIB 213]SJM87557.1 related to Ribosome biogenesis protein SLX9 [Zygosaccharomyces bailii]